MFSQSRFLSKKILIKNYLIFFYSGPFCLFIIIIIFDDGEKSLYRNQKKKLPVYVVKVLTKIQNLTRSV